MKFIGIFSHTDAELALSSLDQQVIGKQRHEKQTDALSPEAPRMP